MSGSNQDIALPTFGRSYDNSGPAADITQLNNLLGTPNGRPFNNPPTPTIFGSRLSGLPSRPYPTPTLDTGLNQAKISNLQTTKVSFQNSYRFAYVTMAKLQPTAKLFFATANVLSTVRTSWTFLFVWPDGNRAWKIIYDSGQPASEPPNITEVAPPLRLIDAQLIDMSRVLDTPDVLNKAESNGLQAGLPVDVVNFQVDGATHQPCFVMTNLSQGKQAVVNAYTGLVVRNEFFR
jgi:hypothetical protein